MYKYLKRTFFAIVLLIRSFFFRNDLIAVAVVVFLKSLVISCKCRLSLGGRMSFLMKGSILKKQRFLKVILVKCMVMIWQMNSFCFSIWKLEALNQQNIELELHKIPYSVPNYFNINKMEP